MKLFKKTTVAAVIAAMFINIPVFCYADSYKTISVTSKTTVPISYTKNATLSTINGVYQKNNIEQKAYAVEMQKGAYGVEVYSGNYVYGRSTINSKLKTLNTNGKKVIAAINGDFFSNATGLPMGAQVVNKKIMATNGNEYDTQVGKTTIGFKADGSVVFGVPNFDIALSFGDFNLKINYVNKMPNLNQWGNDYYLLTSDYAAKTVWEPNTAYDIIVVGADTDAMLNRTVGVKFEKFIENTTEQITIEKNKFYIVAPTGKLDGFKQYLSSLQPTDTETELQIELYGEVKFLETSGKFLDCINIIGGGNLLVNGGQIRYPSTFDSAIANTHTSRTAFGVKADGSYVFYVVEGNNKSKTGVAMEAVAQAMYDMGCVMAVNLDGGGSTTLMADTGNGLGTINAPQDGSQRAISNAIFITSNESAPTVLVDFEMEQNFNSSTGITPSITTEQKFTGNSALRLDYALDYNQGATTEFVPIDVTNYDTLMLALKSDSGVMLEAILNCEAGVFTRPIVSQTYSPEFTMNKLNVNDATQLLGFKLTCVDGAKGSSTVFIDRILGYSGFDLIDTSAPEFCPEISDTTLYVNASEPLFSAGLDPFGAEIQIGGGQTILGYSADLLTAPQNAISKIKISVSDTLGNRAVKYLLYRPATYINALPFVDMQDWKWYSDATRYCFDNGIINGFYENNQSLFKGNQKITRAEFCTMIIRQKKIDTNAYANVSLPYVDTADIPGWALPYVKAAYGTGVMNGSALPNGTVAFYPNKNIIREESAAALDRLVTKDMRLNQNEQYADQSEISGWAKEYVASATRQGLFIGNDKKMFNPKNNLTRYEAAMLMFKL